eukprot:c24370_g1_i1 orf=179-1099(-)
MEDQPAQQSADHSAQVAVTTSSEQSSMALVPAASASMVDASTGALASSNPSHTSSQQSVRETEEGWPMVAKALMLSIMGSQTPTAAVTTILAVFRPMVDGWATARREGKRWRERAEAALAEHHKHKTESGEKHDTLQRQVQDLEEHLAGSESRVRELDSQQSTLRSNVSSLEKKLAEAEADAGAAEEAHAKEAEERKREVEALTKSEQDAKLMYQNLLQDSDDKARAQTAEINKLLDGVREAEAIESELEERLGTAIAKNVALEAELAQRNQEISNSQTRLTELTNQKSALERQLAQYQRIYSRRF